MSPARVTLHSLLTEGSVARVPMDATICTQLLRQARNHLRTAAAGTAAADHEGAFQLAYDACRKTCLALILATGLRPKGEASHAVTFEAASAVAGNFGGRQIVVYASDLRFVRHGTEYRAETVSAEDAQDAIALGEELVEQLAPRIEQILEST